MDYDNNLQNKVKHIRSFATCMRAKEELVLMLDINAPPIIIPIANKLKRIEKITELSKEGKLCQAFFDFSFEIKNMKDGRCPCCGMKYRVGEFRDYLSKKEYPITGLCQKCQDIAYNQYPFDN